MWCTQALRCTRALWCRLPPTCWCYPSSAIPRNSRTPPARNVTSSTPGGVGGWEKLGTLALGDTDVDTVSRRSVVGLNQRSEKLTNNSRP
eukprot:4492812-Pyramimonas_sp.AAC.1